MFRTRNSVRFAHFALVALALVLGGCMTPSMTPPPEPVFDSAADRAETQTATLEQVWRLVD